MSEGHRYTLMYTELGKNLSSVSKSLKYDISADWKGKLIFFTLVKISDVYYMVSIVIKLTWEQLVKTREWYSSTVFQSGGSSVKEKDPSNPAAAWSSSEVTLPNKQTTNLPERSTALSKGVGNSSPEYKNPNQTGRNFPLHPYSQSENSEQKNPNLLPFPGLPWNDILSFCIFCCTDIKTKC